MSGWWMKEPPFPVRLVDEGASTPCQADGQEEPGREEPHFLSGWWMKEPPLPVRLVDRTTSPVLRARTSRSSPLWAVASLSVLGSLALWE